MGPRLCTAAVYDTDNVPTCSNICCRHNSMPLTHSTAAPRPLPFFSPSPSGTSPYQLPSCPGSQLAVLSPFSEACCAETPVLPRPPYLPHHFRHRHLVAYPPTPPHPLHLFAACYQ